MDYNYEPLVLELYSECNGKAPELGKIYRTGETFETRLSIEEATNGRGMTWQQYYLEKYLVEKYNIFDYNKNNNTTLLGANRGWYISNKDGVDPGFGGHMMTITDTTEDGKVYVSSYGKKYLYEVEESHYDIKTEYPLRFDINKRKNKYGEYSCGTYFKDIKVGIATWKDDDGNYLFSMVRDSS